MIASFRMKLADYFAAPLRQIGATYTAVRWRTINQVTPFGLLQLPVRVVQSRANRRYLTLSKALFWPKATRLLSPVMERRALEAVSISEP